MPAPDRYRIHDDYMIELRPAVTGWEHAKGTTIFTTISPSYQQWRLWITHLVGGDRAQIGHAFGAADPPGLLLQLRNALTGQSPRVLDAWFRMALARTGTDEPIPNPRHRRGPGILFVLETAIEFEDPLASWAGGRLGLLPLGCGNHGCAFSVGKTTTRAVKLTFDPTEPQTWALVQELQKTEPAVRAGFARVYKVAHVPGEPAPRRGAAHGPEFYPTAILRENARMGDLRTAERLALRHLNHVAWGATDLTKGGLTRRVNAYQSHLDHYLAEGNVPRMEGILRGLRVMADRRFLIPRIGDDGIGFRRRAWGDAKKGQLILIDPGHPRQVPDHPTIGWLPHP